MQYLSPFHYLTNDLRADILIDAGKIKLARKKLLAEVELSDTQSIFINKKELAKFDIIVLFDSLADPQTYNIHKAIFNDKILLDFLENTTIPVLHDFTKDEQINTPEAIAFISPYYLQIILTLVSTAIITGNATFFTSFFAQHHLLTNEDNFKVHEQIEKKVKAIENKLLLLEKKLVQKVRITNKDIAALEIAKSIAVVNTLPADFNALKDIVGNLLNTFGCSLTKYYYNKFAEHFYIQARKLYCSDNIRQYFRNNLRLAVKSKDKFPIKYGFTNWIKSLMYYSDGNLVVNIKGGQVFVILVVSFLVLNNIFHFDSTEASSNKKVYSIGNINFDGPSDRVHYPMFSFADSNFNKLMYLLDFQHTEPDNQRAKEILVNDSNTVLIVSTKYNKQYIKIVNFKKGDDVYSTLFADSAFKLKKKFTAGKAPLSKMVKIINYTSYECVLIVRNSTIVTDDELITNNFTSYYLPKNDSLNIKLEEGFNDLRPYMGIKLKKNNRFGKTDLALSGDKLSLPYLFDSVPAPGRGLLAGIGIKFLAIGENPSLALMQDSVKHLFIEIGGLLK